MLDLVGHILGEVVRKAPDDGRGGGSVPGLEWADGGHVIHSASAWRQAAIHLPAVAALDGQGGGVGEQGAGLTGGGYGWES